MHCRSSLTALLWLCAVCVPAMQGRAWAQCDSPSIRVQVVSVEAGDAAKGVDPRLGPQITGRLATLFDYHSYRMLKSDEIETKCGETVAFNLPVGRILHVSPIAIHSNQISLDLELFAGERPVMRTQLKVFKGGMLVLVGSRNQQSAYITSITIESAEGNESGDAPHEAQIATPVPSAAPAGEHTSPP
jgi:hypothetical protein